MEGPRPSGVALRLLGDAGGLSAAQYMDALCDVQLPEITLQGLRGFAIEERNRSGGALRDALDALATDIGGSSGDALVTDIVEFPSDGSYESDADVLSG